jgi:hypothetical protein
VGLARTALSLVALASIGLGFASVWPELGRQHERYAQLTPRDVALAGALHEHLDPAAFDRFRTRLGTNERYSLEANFVYRTFAVYWLLPAVPRRGGVTLRWPAS